MYLGILVQEVHPCERVSLESVLSSAFPFLVYSFSLFLFIVSSISMPLGRSFFSCFQSLGEFRSFVRFPLPCLSEHKTSFFLRAERTSTGMPQAAPALLSHIAVFLLLLRVPLVRTGYQAFIWLADVDGNWVFTAPRDSKEEREGGHRKDNEREQDAPPFLLRLFSIDVKEMKKDTHLVISQTGTL